MNLDQAVNRTTNLLATSILVITGLSFLPEMIVETELPFKLDDAGLFVLGLIGFFWYRRGQNRFSRSFIPIYLIFFGLVIKIIGVIMEIKEKDDVGDDFGGTIVFIVAAVIISYIYSQSRKLAKVGRQ